MENYHYQLVRCTETKIILCIVCIFLLV